VNALTVLLVEHRPMLQEKWTATFAPKVRINQTPAPPLVWIASLESIKQTLKKMSALIVKLAKQRQKRQEKLTVRCVTKVLINQNQARPHVWIVSLESTKRTPKKLNALTVKLAKLHQKRQEKWTATFVARVRINQNQARPLVWIASQANTNRTRTKPTASLAPQTLTPVHRNKLCVPLVRLVNILLPQAVLHASPVVRVDSVLVVKSAQSVGSDLQTTQI
jgi:hypothetical protein